MYSHQHPNSKYTKSWHTSGFKALRPRDTRINNIALSVDWNHYLPAPYNAQTETKRAVKTRKTVVRCMASDGAAFMFVRAILGEEAAGISNSGI